MNDFFKTNEIALEETKSHHITMSCRLQELDKAFQKFYAEVGR